MLRSVQSLVVLGTLLGGATAWAEDKPTQIASAAALDGELSDLSKGGFEATNKEKIYVVQDRHVNLTNHVQVNAALGTNVNSNIYLDTRESSLSLRYHFNNTVFMQLDGSRVNNELTESGQKIWERDGIYPDTSFVKSRMGASVGLNAMYGKVRVTKDFMFYFDQFFTLGVGRVVQDNGIKRSSVSAYMGEAGLSIGVGKMASILIGVRDHYFEEQRIASASRIHQIVAYSGVGILLGSETL